MYKLKWLLDLSIKFLFILILMTFNNSNTFANSINESGEWENTLNEIVIEQPLKQIGKAKFTVFIWDVYESELLTSSGQYPELSNNGTLIYNINYLRSITSKELITRTIEQWVHLGIKQDIYGDYIPELEQIWPNINAGDSLAIVVKDNKSAFYFNNRFIGIIDDPTFGSVFMDIWLSKNTSEPELREALLGFR